MPKTVLGAKHLHPLSGHHGIPVTVKVEAKTEQIYNVVSFLSLKFVSFYADSCQRSCTVFVLVRLGSNRLYLFNETAFKDIVLDIFFVSNGYNDGYVTPTASLERQPLNCRHDPCLKSSQFF